MPPSGTEPTRAGWGRRATRLLAVASLALTGLALDAVTMASPAAAADVVVVTGHGWGHGRGMGQYGALGYAVNLNRDYQWILNHFYGGTTLGTIDPGQTVSVLLCSLEANVTCTSPRDVGALFVTSGIDFTIEGVVFPATTVVRIQHDGVQAWNIDTAPNGCSGVSGPFTPFGPSVDGAIDIASTDPNPGDDRSRMITVCNSLKPYRGTIHAIRDGGNTRVLNFAPLDQYLRGVVPAESPASWGTLGGGKGMNALRAQAVAARSYAMSTQRHPYALTCDTIACQVYNGANAEAATTDQAIAETAGMVRKTGSGAVSRTEFSSSTGGWTAGGVFPAVIDEGDAVAANPNHNWETSIPIANIQSAYPSIGTLQRFEGIVRNGLGADGGRVNELTVVGTSGRVTVTGNEFRSRFGLKSDWFTPQNPPPPTPGQPPPPSAGVVWMVRTSATAGPPTSTAAYGIGADLPISCDWDDDGDDTLGVYNGGTWSLRDDLSAGAPTRTFAYGGPGYRPVCGDWNGDGRDSIGVYSPDGWWLLRNDVGPGPPEIAFRYGYAAATPVVANRDPSDPADEIGVYDAGAWFLRNDVGPGPPQQTVSYGYRGALPVTGDWDGDGLDGFGVYDKGVWMLRETASPGQPTRSFAYGYEGPKPVTGRWTTSADGIGIIAAR